ncbi:DUF202 domain-containing protein [Phytomonospora endophytica]|uniref:Uncharacterized membrane protein YidH (DUF202 family) n=1 Tax=Phytomonospora endophytica TaxID=714109 RepID=A0A841FN27_9ACTN|nr:DUF202 domain-containing protein [Phytomonospora endophytica]MBB6037254.1 uncharacterized membrane protein YidH (DUF202 family) [Phytomonospora endophytica]GIG71245.1 hypothetical protein Pen01_75400 [Phytomonospora endophytica]
MSGLAAERTRLAWRRTVLSFSVAIVLFCKPAFTGVVRRADIVIIAVTALLWVLATIAGHRRIVDMDDEAPAAMRPRTAYALAGLVLLLAVAGLAITFM